MDKDEVLLKAILRELEIIPELLEGYSLEEFMTSQKTQRAICMTLLNIGELVKGLSVELKEKYRGVPWKDISGLRDLAAHKYQSLNMERIYLTATEYAPSLKQELVKIIRTFP